MVDRRREQQTVRTVEALRVPGVAPGLDVAPDEMREVVDACDPARALEAEHPLLEEPLAAPRVDDIRPLGVGDVARLE